MTTSTQTTSQPNQGPSPAELVFQDPVSYLADFGIEASLVSTATSQTTGAGEEPWPAAA